ncbi:MAG: GNAT family N-acetyltransferase [Gemmatimonadota bacterium]|nr:GNAT family N-acetyltransferase [Gemmatimonadota bacterium]
MEVIRTPRLLLIPATIGSLYAELESHDALARVLGADVPASWPPELYDDDAIRWTLNQVQSHPEDDGWILYYIAEIPASPGDRPRLAGTGGYKGAPDAAGIVEIGYGVIPERRRLGIAREATEGLLERAFADSRVTTVIAHTLRELAPSIAVLRSAGFIYVGAGSDLSEPDAIRYELTRSEYERTRGA